MQQSHSWEGEDVLALKLARAVFGIQQGFYVDIGAHHPLTMSNTALLYANGWRGINVDATPGTVELFERHRPDDTNLELGVGGSSKSMWFYRLSNPSLNGFLSDVTLERHKARGYEVLGKTLLTCVTFDDLMDTYFAGDSFDLLSIDAEGHDYEIIEAMSGRWRPKILICEQGGNAGIRSLLDAPITRLLESRGYEFFSRLHFSSVFLDTKAKQLAQSGG